MKRTTRSITTSITLMLMLLLQPTLPLAKVFAQDKARQGKRIQEEDVVSTNLYRYAPRIDSTRQAEIEAIAQTVADTLVLKDDGTAAINTEKATKLSRKQLGQLNSVIKDINSGHIGMAVVREDGLRVYGNTQVLNEISPSGDALRGSTTANGKPQSTDQTQAFISTWWDGYGYAIYLDPSFTSRLKSFDNVAIGAIIGLMATALCGTGVGCFAFGVVVAFFWDQVWQWLDRRYYADSLIIHIPKWNWVYIQPFKAGAWFNGQWFRTWLWT